MSDDAPRDTPRDAISPAARPHGTTADQVAEMEYEGQGQGPKTPSPDPDGSERPRRRKSDANEPPPPATESAAEDQALDTAATGLLSSDDDEGHTGR